MVFQNTEKYLAIRPFIASKNTQISLKSQARLLVKNGQFFIKPNYLFQTSWLMSKKNTTQLTFIFKLT